ncbi:hypothetical protein PV762_27200 [Mitsuaria sp. CC2]|uniref:hypothetical protein n=1 Tax=Mitsuaria sp. CC2 TaxID=3029186 RepID=UPI003B8B2F93
MDRDKRKAYLDRKKAVEMCVAGSSNAAIKRACGIGLKQATRLIKERCMLIHADGRIFGFRALVKSLRINPYTRTKPVAIDAFGRGGAGAMSALLSLDPEFKKKLDRKILTGMAKGELTEVKRSRVSLWRWFLDELRARKYEIRREWPFSSEQPGGYAALNRYADSVLKDNPRRLAQDAGGESAVRKLRAGDGVDRPTMRPFQRVEMDGHKLDGRFCVLLPDRDGWVARIIHRLWVTVLIETYSRAVLGYFLSLGREVPKDDVLRAIKSALTRWVPRPVTFSDTAMADGAGLPSVLGDRFVGLCWEETSVDGALAETCRSVKEQLALVVGSDLLEPANSFSVRRSLDDRPFIETFFRTLGDRGLQRLSNSTGASPQARKVVAPDAVAVASQFQYEYLEELLQSLICNYNATPHSSLGYRSPLQMLSYLDDRGTLPQRRADPNLVQGLLTYRKLCPVHGGAGEGRPPYVNFANARYGGPTIRDREDLVGKMVWMSNHLEDDARVARCTLTSGELVGVLRAAPPWDKLPHSLAVRRQIKALEKSKRLKSLGCDAIRAFLQFVETQPNKKLPVHPAYLAVRRVLAQEAQNFEGDRAADRALRTLTGLAPETATQLDEEAKKSSESSLPPPQPPSSPSRKTPSDSATRPSVSRRPLPARRLAEN